MNLMHSAACFVLRLSSDDTCLTNTVYLSVAFEIPSFCQLQLVYSQPAFHTSSPSALLIAHHHPTWFLRLASSLAERAKSSILNARSHHQQVKGKRAWDWAKASPNDTATGSERTPY
jgi:hypothetical protein